MADYSKLPSKVKVKPTPFKAHAPEEKITQMKELIKISPIGPVSYENQQEDRAWGLTRQWLSDAKDHWANKFDWSVFIEYAIARSNVITGGNMKNASTAIPITPCR